MELQKVAGSPQQKVEKLEELNGVLQSVKSRFQTFQTRIQNQAAEIIEQKQVTRQLLKNVKKQQEIDISAIRKFLLQQGLIDIETPLNSSQWVYQIIDIISTSSVLHSLQIVLLTLAYLKAIGDQKRKKLIMNVWALHQAHKNLAPVQKLVDQLSPLFKMALRRRKKSNDRIGPGVGIGIIPDFATNTLLNAQKKLLASPRQTAYHRQLLRKVSSLLMNSKNVNFKQQISLRYRTRIAKLHARIDAYEDILAKARGNMSELQELRPLLEQTVQEVLSLKKDLELKQNESSSHYADMHHARNALHTGHKEFSALSRSHHNLCATVTDLLGSLDAADAQVHEQLQKIQGFMNAKKKASQMVHKNRPKKKTAARKNLP
jgi:hypothetical protein